MTAGSRIAERGDHYCSGGASIDVSGLLTRRAWPLALMRSADQPPIKASRFIALGTGRGLSIPGSTGSPSTHSHPCKVFAADIYAAAANSSFRYRRSSRRTAQMMRAVLFAIATAATFAGGAHFPNERRLNPQNRRTPNSPSQAGGIAGRALAARNLSGLAVMDAAVIAGRDQVVHVHVP